MRFPSHGKKEKGLLSHSCYFSKNDGLIRVKHIQILANILGITSYFVITYIYAVGTVGLYCTNITDFLKLVNQIEQINFLFRYIVKEIVDVTRNQCWVPPYVFSQKLAAPVQETSDFVQLKRIYIFYLEIFNIGPWCVRCNILYRVKCLGIIPLVSIFQ